MVCPCGAVPGDGQQGKAAAAATGEGVWGQLLPRQDLQHTGLPPKEVRDETHELQQRDGVVPARWGGRRSEVIFIFNGQFSYNLVIQHHFQESLTGDSYDLFRDSQWHLNLVDVCIVIHKDLKM